MTLRKHTRPLSQNFLRAWELHHLWMQNAQHSKLFHSLRVAVPMLGAPLLTSVACLIPTCNAWKTAQHAL